MMQTMYNDEVLSIQVVDKQGKVLTHLARTPGNEPLEIFDDTLASLPREVGVDHMSSVEGDILVCWEKVNVGVDLGWIRLDMMGAVDGGELDVIKRNAFVLSAISILLGLTALGVFLWRAYFTAIRRELSVTDKLKDTSELLYQSEKLAALGQLSAGVAHEINNPIGYVSSNIASLVRRIKKSFTPTNAIASQVKTP
jgi:signal transduction histidine kinase